MRHARPSGWRISGVFCGLALAAGLLAACGAPEDGASPAEIAQAAARQADRVEVEELARWLVEGRQDILLLDVRPAAAYENGRIEAARNTPIATLFAGEALAGLPRDRRLVVYSNGSENAAKAAVLLRLQGFDAHLLVGGYNAWQARILNPDIPAEELDGENPRISEQRALACYFVGGDAGARRPDPVEQPFVPPVIPEAGEQEPLPPVGDESC